MGLLSKQMFTKIILLATLYDIEVFLEQLTNHVAFIFKIGKLKIYTYSISKSSYFFSNNLSSSILFFSLSLLFHHLKNFFFQLFLSAELFNSFSSFKLIIEIQNKKFLKGIFASVNIDLALLNVTEIFDH